MIQVVGADGYPRGWVAIALNGGAYGGAASFRHFADILAAFPGAEVIGVDIPISLLPAGRREADRAAGALVGPRRSSVFWTPPREVVEALGYREAAARCLELTGQGLSRQSYGLRSKILEVDRLVGADDRVVEMHPEVSFRAMAGRPLLHPKKTWNGFVLRKRLLAAAGIELPPDLGGAGEAGADDVLDAAAVAWSAHRVARGKACSVPEQPEQDDRGRAVAIWY